MPFQPVILWSDALLWGLLAVVAVLVVTAGRDPLLRAAWRKVGASRPGMAAATLLAGFLLIGLADSLHYRERLPATMPDGPVSYAVEVRSLLDLGVGPLRTAVERTYSAPMAIHSYAKETVERADGTTARDFPRLRHGGAHLADADGHSRDLVRRAASALLPGAIGWLALVAALTGALARRERRPLREVIAGIWGRRAGEWSGERFAWDAVLATLLPMFLAVALVVAFAGHYHLLGTDKVGQDVLYQMLKSVRTALVIGLVTTLVTLPIGVVLGIAAGYFRGVVDDVIQYLYTTISSVPGVLLIAAGVLMMQVILDTHPEWFETAAERADMRLLALCFILGLTSWTGLARLLRGETLKLSQLEYVQAAQAFGLPSLTILFRHLLPNLMHIVIIALVMDFSGLVLAEAVLSYVGIGVDPNMISFGTMINNARMELGREPVVWWSLAGAFVFMFVLVLAANLFADAVRDAFDPRFSTVRG
jgi:peptide/nickel transport system permease protein